MHGSGTGNLTVTLDQFSGETEIVRLEGDKGQNWLELNRTFTLTGLFATVSRPIRCASKTENGSNPTYASPTGDREITHGLISISNLRAISNLNLSTYSKLYPRCRLHALTGR